MSPGNTQAKAVDQKAKKRKNHDDGGDEEMGEADSSMGQNPHKSKVGKMRESMDEGESIEREAFHRDQGSAKKKPTKPCDDNDKDNKDEAGEEAPKKKKHHLNRNQREKAKKLKALAAGGGGGDAPAQDAAKAEEKKWGEFVLL
jgi:hypothetical protein